MDSMMLSSKEMTANMVVYSKQAKLKNTRESIRDMKALDYVKIFLETSAARDNSPLQGAAVGFMRNYLKYVVSTNGRSTNVLNIFDKAIRSSLGNPKWWIRYDLPHGSTNFNHVNINKAITGLKDPHIHISWLHMQTAKYVGKVAEKANEWAPYIAYVAFAIDTGRMAYGVYKDYNEGTTKNTATTAASIAGGYSGGAGGAWAGASIGTMIAPGLGTLIGGFVGAMIGGIYGNSTAKNLAESYYEEPPKKSDQ